MTTFKLRAYPTTFLSDAFSALSQSIGIGTKYCQSTIAPWLGSAPQTTMEDFPFSYQKIDSTTWAYLSSLLMVALFFKFNRFWSFRNWDLLFIVLLAPGLLMVDGGRRMVNRQQAIPTISQATNADNQASHLSSVESDSIANVDPQVSAAQQKLKADDSADSKNNSASLPQSDADALDTIGHRWQRFGYGWLFTVGLLLLIRLLLDPALTRRPVLPPNLSRGGLFFFAGSLMLFLTANVVLSEPSADDLKAARNAIKLMQREAADDIDVKQLRRRGPGYAFFYVFPILPMFENGGEIMDSDADELANVRRYVTAAKILAIVTQGFIVMGLIFFCKFNFDSVDTGVGAAAIYLMLPYTAMFTGHVIHTLPAALILWAVISFRRPWISGILIGLATGVAYYPVFLLPLWLSFYWERGVRNFLFGVLFAIIVCVSGLMFTSVGGSGFLIQLRSMFGFWQPIMEGLEGIWALGWSSWWRMPILVAFVAFCVSFVAWPSEKNIGTLVSYSAAIMVAVQFWHGFGGGLIMAWYLPLLLLTIFRPNLTGRVASKELPEIVRRNVDPTDELATAN
jgi:hypothetical protein